MFSNGPPYGIYAKKKGHCNLFSTFLFNRCENIVLGCTYDRVLYSGNKCCSKFFGNRRYVTDLAALCVSTHFQPPLEEIFDSQIYGFTAYLKTNVVDRFGIQKLFL